MPDFLLAATVLVLLTVVLGLVRILRDTSDAKRMMAVQLLATGGVAALLLFGTASGTEGTVDVALTLALLAAFAAIAFVKKGGTGETTLPDARDMRDMRDVRDVRDVKPPPRDAQRGAR